MSQASSGQPRSIRKTTPSPDPELGVGSVVEVMSTTTPMYGLIKWVGHLPDQKEPKKLIAGLEMVNAFNATTKMIKNCDYFIIHKLNKCFG